MSVQDYFGQQNWFINQASILLFKYVLQSFNYVTLKAYNYLTELSLSQHLFFSPSSTFPLHSPQWVVSPADKIKYDEIFVKTDKDMDGFVSGVEARELFLKTGLPSALLAHIWQGLFFFDSYLGDGMVLALSQHFSRKVEAVIFVYDSVAPVLTVVT